MLSWRVEGNWWRVEAGEEEKAERTVLSAPEARDSDGAASLPIGPKTGGVPALT